MRLAQVVGTVVSSAKDIPLLGKKLLLLQPIDRQGRPHGRKLVGLDSVGAGVGERVFYVRGKEAAFPWHPTATPSDCTIVGILDQFNFPEAGP